MLNQIRGLHHVTSMAGDAQRNNRFFTEALGLRRVKKTVNFDAPDVYHLYYGDERGRPGSVMTYFPFPNIAKGRPGTGEVGTTAFSVPEGSLGFWQERLGKSSANPELSERFGERRLLFAGPDGDRFAIVESPNDQREAWTDGGIGADHAIYGFHSVAMRLREAEPTDELLKFMGYEQIEHAGNVRRYSIKGEDNGAAIVDLEIEPLVDAGRQGAGSVHHVAFSVANRDEQLKVREALGGAGLQVTPVIDRDYFWAIYFRTPGGVLFEIATDEPGFDRDEELAHLGQSLKLPSQHEHLRSHLESHLQPIEASNSSGSN